MIIINSSTIKEAEKEIKNKFLFKSNFISINDVYSVLGLSKLIKEEYWGAGWIKNKNGNYIPNSLLKNIFIKERKA